MKFCLSLDLRMETTSKQLVLKNISKHFGELVAVKDVDLVIEPAEFICFLGPSGCGKTTLLRIITGLPLPYFIAAGYLVVIAQTIAAPKEIVPLAYDSGGVTTSTVTVPLVAALGLGLADAIPGRSPLLDGFGLIAFTALFPIITVLAYGQFAALRQRTGSPRGADEKPE